MKSFLLSITIFISVFFIQAESFAQTRTINGMVYTFDSIPLINANIKVKSSKQEVKSDATGQFTVECTSNDVLEVSANGFSSEKVKITVNSGNVNVNLKLKSGDKNTKAAINSGHISNIESFKAIVNKLNAGEDFSQYANIYEIIQGKFPGVQILNGEIIIRGLNNMELNATNNGNAALVVVDGVINNSSILNTLPTSLVKSIKILKGGESAKYGARGTNGVVVIETKKEVAE